MSKRQPQTTIIFDLDGTLADSIPLLIEIVNDLGVVDRKLTRDDYEKAKNLTVKEILKELGVPLWRAPGLLVKGRASLTKRIHEVPFFEGMDKTVRDLSRRHHLFVMSSNSLENVQKFLENHKIENVFQEIHGGVGIFSKAKMLRKIVKERGLDPAKTYYVGDEIRDVEAAKKAGLKSVAVTWGFNGEKILRKHAPDFIVKIPGKLTDIFEDDK